MVLSGMVSHSFLVLWRVFQGPKSKGSSNYGTCVYLFVFVRLRGACGCFKCVFQSISLKCQNTKATVRYFLVGGETCVWRLNYCLPSITCYQFVMPRCAWMQHRCSNIMHMLKGIAFRSSTELHASNGIPYFSLWTFQNEDKRSRR